MIWFIVICLALAILMALGEKGKGPFSLLDKQKAVGSNTKRNVLPDLVGRPKTILGRHNKASESKYDDTEMLPDKFEIDFQAQIDNEEPDQEFLSLLQEEAEQQSQKYREPVEDYYGLATGATFAELAELGNADNSAKNDAPTSNEADLLQLLMQSNSDRIAKLLDQSAFDTSEADTGSFTDE